jgi:hypothetical protein
VRGKGHVRSGKPDARGYAIVNLVAADERISRYRHPLPTAETVERYAMLVLCFRRAGLMAALTRLVHFGLLPDKLRAKMRAVAEVDAAMIAGTQPGRTLGQMFARARATYATVGYSEASTSTTRAVASPTSRASCSPPRTPRGDRGGPGVRVEPLDSRREVRGYHRARAAWTGGADRDARLADAR